MRGYQFLGIIIAVALIVFAIAYPVPEKHLRVNGYSDEGWNSSTGEEYVGGDAYNFQMEASLKSGYMGGVLAMKSTTFVGGLLLLFMTLYSRIKCAAVEEQIYYLKELASASQTQDALLKKIVGSMDGQRNILRLMSDTLDKYMSNDAENTTEK